MTSSFCLQLHDYKNDYKNYKMIIKSEKDNLNVFQNICDMPYFFNIMCDCFGCLYAHASHACSTFKDQKEASDCLELELWATLGVLGTEPGSSRRVASTVSHWIIF